MRAQVDPQGHPARVLEEDLELDGVPFAVGDDPSSLDSDAVDHELDGYSPRPGQACLLEIPVRLLAEELQPLRSSPRRDEG